MYFKFIYIVNIMKIYIIIILIIILIIIYIYIYKRDTYIKSELDNKEYLVKHLNNKEEAAYILSLISKKIMILKNHLINNIENYKEYSEYINQLKDRTKNLKILENAPNGKYTSYTINKGEEMGICIRSKNINFHDFNIIIYVVIHELAHIACPDIGHTELFKKIFIFLLNVSTKLKIYKKIDYHINPQEYCGIIINEKII